MSNEAQALDVGDSVVLTGVARDRPIGGLGLPGWGEAVGTEVEIVAREEVLKTIDGNVSHEVFRVRTDDGTETTVKYNGRSPVKLAGDALLSQSNSQGAQQSWSWEAIDS